MFCAIVGSPLAIFFTWWTEPMKSFFTLKSSSSKCTLKIWYPIYTHFRMNNPVDSRILCRTDFLPCKLRVGKNGYDMTPPWVSCVEVQELDWWWAIWARWRESNDWFPWLRTLYRPILRGVLCYGIGGQISDHSSLSKMEQYVATKFGVVFWVVSMYDG